MTGKREAKPPVPESENDMGLTPDERAVHEKLMDCLNTFLKLDREHPDELSEFVNAIHQIQGVLCMRVVRRSYPKGWPTYEVSSNA